MSWFLDFSLQLLAHNDCLFFSGKLSIQSYKDFSFYCAWTTSLSFFCWFHYRLIHGYKKIKAIAKSGVTWVKVRSHYTSIHSLPGISIKARKRGVILTSYSFLQTPRDSSTLACYQVGWCVKISLQGNGASWFVYTATAVLTDS